MTKASDNVFAKLLLAEGSAPATPSSGQVVVYAKTDGSTYQKDDAGTETGLAGGGGGSGTGWTTIVRKTANETVNASTTLQNDDHLLIALGTSQVWEFECVLWYASGTTPDFKIAFTVPASSELYFAVHGTSEADASLGGGLIDGSGTTRGLQGGGPSATDPTRFAKVTGLVITAGTSGNLQLQWAQNTSNASDTIVFANSTLKGYRLV